MIMGSEEQNSNTKSCEDNDESSLPESGNSNSRYNCLLTVEPVVFCLFLADCLGDSITQNFIIRRTCEVHLNFNKSVCAELEKSDGNETEIETLVQPYSAVVLTAMNFISTLIPAFMSPFLGPWSDKNGRKLLIVVPAFGYFCRFALLTVFSFFSNLGPEYALLTVIPVAFSGGVVNFITSAYSYVSDISLEKDRSFRISLLEASMYLGPNIGFLSASYIYSIGGNYGYSLVFGVSALLILISVVPTYLFLKDSIQPTEDSKGISGLFELQLLKDMLKVCFKKREGWRRAIIFLIITSLSFTVSAGIGESNVFFLFTRFQYQWNIQQFTFWSSESLTIAFLGIILGSLIFSKWLKTDDAILGFISYLLKALAHYYITFIPPKSSYLMYYFGLINIFSGLCGPVSRAILSKSVQKEDLGKVFALTGSFEAILPLAVGPLYTLMYNSSLHSCPTIFLWVSGTVFIANSLFFVIIYFIQNQSPEPVDYSRLENEDIIA